MRRKRARRRTACFSRTVSKKAASPASRVPLWIANAPTSALACGAIGPINMHRASRPPDPPACRPGALQRGASLPGPNQLRTSAPESSASTRTSMSKNCFTPEVARAPRPQPPPLTSHHGTPVAVDAQGVRPTAEAVGQGSARASPQPAPGNTGRPRPGGRTDGQSPARAEDPVPGPSPPTRRQGHRSSVSPGPSAARVCSPESLESIHSPTQ